MLNSKLCAQDIRKELKVKFPNTKFYVRHDNSVCSVRIEYDKNSTVKKDLLETTLKKYESYSYNAIEDYWDFTNDRPELNQAMYVIISYI